jgi:hypothetical protein
MMSRILPVAALLLLAALTLDLAGCFVALCLHPPAERAPHGSPS